MHIQRFSLSVPVYTWGHDEKGNYVRTEHPPEKVTVDVVVDVEGLANKYVRRAMSNKSNEAAEAGGLVKIKVV